jgi:hypothetical protein
MFISVDNLKTFIAKVAISPQKALDHCTQTTCPMADALARCILQKDEKSERAEPARHYPSQCLPCQRASAYVELPTSGERSG